MRESAPPFASPVLVYDDDVTVLGVYSIILQYDSIVDDFLNINQTTTIEWRPTCFCENENLQ